jgi:hypothetical protein
VVLSSPEFHRDTMIMLVARDKSAALADLVKTLFDPVASCSRYDEASRFVRRTSSYVNAAERNSKERRQPHYFGQ